MMFGLPIHKLVQYNTVCWCWYIWRWYV